jgi:GntP family gluconate:H+ symporter
MSCCDVSLPGSLNSLLPVPYSLLPTPCLRIIALVTPSAHAHDFFLLGCVAATVAALLLLITKVRLHAAVALAVGAFGLGIGSGMTLKQVPLSFTAGVGNMMGHIAIILGLGAILGCLLARSGGAQALGSAIVDNSGPRGMPFALMGLGIVVGMPVFFEVGLVLLMPIIAAAAKRAGKPPILTGLPLLAGLSIVHGTLPPHPAAMLAATQYHADLGRTIVLGLIIGIPSAILAGPCVEWAITWLRRRRGTLETLNKEQAVFGGEAMSAPREPDTRKAHSEKIPPPAGPVRAACAVLLPIALIFLGSWSDTLAAPGTSANNLMRFIGSPDVALLIAVLVALFTLGPRVQTGRHHGAEMLRQLTAESFEPIANVMVILAAAGGLSGVLRDSGAAQATVSLALGAHMPWCASPWVRPPSPWPSPPACSHPWQPTPASRRSCLSSPPAPVRSCSRTSTIPASG